MEYVIIWVALCILAGIIASNKGRSGVGFFFLSLILSPLVGIIAALVVASDTEKVEQKKLESSEYKRCQYCAELIKAEAIVCKHCGKDQPERKQTELLWVKSLYTDAVIETEDGEFLAYGKSFSSREEAEAHLDTYR